MVYDHFSMIYFSILLTLIKIKYCSLKFDNFLEIYYKSFMHYSKQTLIGWYNFKVIEKYFCFNKYLQSSHSSPKKFRITLYLITIKRIFTFSTFYLLKFIAVELLILALTFL